MDSKNKTNVYSLNRIFYNNYLIERKHFQEINRYNPGKAFPRSILTFGKQIDEKDVVCFKNVHIVQKLLSPDNHVLRHSKFFPPYRTETFPQHRHVQIPAPLPIQVPVTVVHTLDHVIQVAQEAVQAAETADDGLREHL